MTDELIVFRNKEIGGKCLMDDVVQVTDEEASTLQSEMSSCQTHTCGNYRLNELKMNLVSDNNLSAT